MNVRGEVKKSDVKTYNVDEKRTVLDAIIKIKTNWLDYIMRTN